jgi:hypothetical protein
MSSRAIKQSLMWGSILLLAAALFLVNRFVELSPWAWAAFLAAAGAAALGLHLADRSDGWTLLAGYTLCAIAGLIALVPTNLLRDEAIAGYVLLAIALPCVGAFLRDRARWWALIPAYLLVAIVGVIALAEWGQFGDDVISTYVLSIVTLPFLVLYLWGRKQRWSPFPAAIVALIGLAFLVIDDGAVRYVAGAVLVAGVGMLVHVLVRLDRPAPSS